ncbi:hypothetical protein R1flu_021683 [Riccia fluitans]|uniref:Serine/threonine-protein phosphatase 4 regulatory subunit 2 n=1 Tax=Riccia fluitans TaxID=41844 RepID=A0ABD1ZRP5_9MARC
MHDQAERLPGSKALSSFCEKDDSAREFTKELRSVLEVTAATGRYWHEWAQLKLLLCFRLTQVLRQFHKVQYPDGAPMIGPLPPGREPFEEMVERLVQYLDSFTDGAPFTYQRLCEILLNPNNTYKNIDKLALAFEKILLVQSTYPPSSDSYPLGSFPNDLLPDRNGGGQGNMELMEAANGKQDGVGSLKEMPTVIDEEMVDVERVLDAQVAGGMANTSSDMQHEASIGEIPQAAGNALGSEMLHDSAGVDLLQIPGTTSSQMVDDSSGGGTILPHATSSEMEFDPTNIYAVSAAAPVTNTETDVLHESTAAGLPSGLPSAAPDTSLGMVQDSPAATGLPQAPDTSLAMVQGSLATGLPRAPDTNVEMVQDSPATGELQSATGNNSVAGLEEPHPTGSNTDMLHDSAAVELPLAAAVPEAVASNAEVMNDASVVGLLSAAVESIDRVDAKPNAGSEAGASNQGHSSGVSSPHGNVDMKQSGQEESMNSHDANCQVEGRSEDVSMGIVG